MLAVDWGRHYLMCSPDYFDVEYSINPWMDVERRPDRDRAKSQWQALVDRLRAVGATIDVMPPADGFPDMVFTANHGVVMNGTLLPGSFQHSARAGELPHARAWLSSLGYHIAGAEVDGLILEGSGEVLPFGDTFVVGHGVRSQVAAASLIERIFGVPTLAVRLKEPRFYHLDLLFCPLDREHAMVFPDGLAPASAKALLELIPKPILLDREEALRFCANSVVVDRAVLMPACPPRVERTLTRAGFHVEVVEVGEFQLAGGAIRCMTLPLDIGVKDRHWPGRDRCLQALSCQARNSTTSGVETS